MSRAANRSRFPGGRAVTIDVSNLRARFRVLRRARGISQGQVARLIDVCQSTISGFEQGRHRGVRNETLLALQRLVRQWESETIAIEGSAGSMRSVVKGRAFAETECPVCGARVFAGDRPARYCSSCGACLAVRCGCGAYVLDSGAVYCARCGKRLVAALREAKRGGT